VRQVLIPKDGTPQATRPLGINTLEDKVVQVMMHRVLESIYEPLFLDCSYGFRPGRGCHEALRALHQHLYHKEVETISDLDIANYFGTIDHGLLEAMLHEKITDERFLRYVKRMFKAGVLTAGELTVSEEGVPQGRCVSPLLRTSSFSMGWTKGWYGLFRVIHGRALRMTAWGTVARRLRLRTC
jgi:retron-type reverse transcriptase